MRPVLCALMVCALSACAQPEAGRPTLEVARALGGDADLGTRNVVRVNTGGSTIGRVNISVFSRLQREYERAWDQNYAQQQQRGRPTPSGRM